MSSCNETTNIKAEDKMVLQASFVSVFRNRGLLQLSISLFVTLLRMVVIKSDKVGEKVFLYTRKIAKF
jgi:hypothetical protein